MTKTTLLILAPGFEEIEAVTVIDILRRAHIQITTASLGDLKVTGSHGITLIADQPLQEVKGKFDAFILPGGMPGATNLAASPLVADILMKNFIQGNIIAAICASPAVVLAPLGILEQKNATCFEGMENLFPKTAQFSSSAVVVDGNLITSRGPGTALEFALTIVEKMEGETTRQTLQKATLLNNEGFK